MKLCMIAKCPTNMSIISEDISIVILNCNEKHVKELYMCYNESTIQSKA
jgi:hypothetical protein